MSETIIFKSKIGPVTIVCTDTGVSQVSLGGIQPAHFPEIPGSQLLEEMKKQILQYLDGVRKSFDVPLDWQKITGFQKDVLTIVAKIPFGEIMTYGQIAHLLNKPAASRAVGGAMARNPLLILIPCHRVVASSGKLTGYAGAGGVQTKQWLLEREGHIIVDQKLD